MEPSVPATRFEQSPNLEMRFPPLSRTVAEVSQLLAEQDDVPDTPQLGEIIHRDPVMAATVLRRVNSAYYGMRRRITNIRKAVRLLGFLEACHIVLTASMLQLRDVLRSDQQSAIYDQLIQLSLGAASFAQAIAEELKLAHKSSAFTAGLLHSVGRMVLLYNRSNDYEALWRTTDDGLMPSADAEELIFGTDHTKLGALAANHWNLPSVVVKVIRSYLTPGHLREEDLRLLALTIAVSVSATQQLCMRRPAPSDADAPDGFEPGAAAHALARATGRRSADLVAFVESQADEVNAYVDAMLTTTEADAA